MLRNLWNLSLTNINLKTRPGNPGLYKYMKLITILLILMSTTVYANSEEAIVTCKTIQEAKEKKQGLKSQSTAFLSSIKSFFSRSYAKPLVKEVSINSNNLVTIDEGPDEKPKKNYIFVFNPLIDDQELNEELNSYEEDLEHFEHLRNNLKKLVKESKYEKCLNKYKDYPVTEKKFNFMSSKLKSNKNVNNHLSSKELRNQVYRAAKRFGLKNEWIIVKYLTVQNLRERLESLDTANIIIAAHSSPDGNLIDSTGKVIPLSIFKKVSPTIKSLVVFSCFGKEVLTNYNLQENLKNSESIYKERQVVVVGESSEENKTPVKAFGSFLKKQDSRIHREMRKSKKDSEANLYNDKGLCSIALNSNDKTGSFIVYLNNLPISAVQFGRNKYEFSCNLLGSDNKIRVTNRTTSYPPLNIFVELVYEDHEISNENVYTAPNGSFDGLNAKLFLKH